MVERDNAGTQRTPGRLTTGEQSSINRDFDIISREYDFIDLTFLALLLKLLLNMMFLITKINSENKSDININN